MAVALHTRTAPLCSACIRSFAWVGLFDTTSSHPSSLRQQIRGKKINTKTTHTVPARLLKDVTGFGKRGAIVPIARGQMRNQFYPSRIAEYVSQSEQRALLKNNVTIERDYTFAVEPKSNPSESPMMSLEEEPVAAPARPRGHEVEKLSVERSMELLEIFVPPRMDFYRQPILEDRAEESDPWENSSRQRTASSAASDLLAARAEAAAQKLKKADSIYGSVSTHDILVAVRASIARNDEAARVILAEDEITFMDEPARSEQKVKSIGDFTVELKPRGAATGLKRTVRVIPQDA